jgi:hypothetical protein
VLTTTDHFAHKCSTGGHAGRGRRQGAWRNRPAHISLQDSTLQVSIDFSALAPRTSSRKVHIPEAREIKIMRAIPNLLRVTRVLNFGQMVLKFSTANSSFGNLLRLRNFLLLPKQDESSTLCVPIVHYILCVEKQKSCVVCGRVNTGFSVSDVPGI